MNVQAINTFHKTRLGYLVFGLVELGLFILLANWSIGSGAWWGWLLAIVLFIGFLQNFGRMVMHKK